MPYAWTNGFRTYYEDEGEGFPIVFVHGHTFDRTMWEYQVDALLDEGEYRTVIMDLRGHGLSEMPITGYWPASYMQDLRALMDHLAIQRAVLVGNSVGGSVVTHFALDYPARTAALVLAGSGGLGGPPQDPERIVMHKGMWEVTAARGYLAAIEEYWIPGPLLRGARKRPEVNDRVKEMVRGYSGQGFRDVRRSTDEPSRSAEISQIRCLTLIIHGDLDTADVRSGADLAERTIPRAQHVIIPDTGHTAMLEEPEVFNQHLLAFLQKALSADRQPPRRR